MGLVRDEDSGAPIAGATLESEDAGSLAVIRYLDDDQLGCNTMMTGTSGIFVIVNPELGEGFDAFKDGGEIGGNAGGTVDGAIFSMVIQ